MKTGILNWKRFFILLVALTVQAVPAYCINPPVNLLAYATSPSTAVVKWANSDQTATTFYLCQSTDGITFTLAGSTPAATPPQTYYNVTGLTPNTGYFFDVETSNDCGTIPDTTNSFYLHTAGYLTTLQQVGGATTDGGSGVDVNPLMIKSNSSGAYVIVGTIGGDAGTVNFNSGKTLTASATVTSYYIVEYSASGLAQWVKTLALTDGSSITGYTISALAIDASGNAAITGQYFNSTTGASNAFASKYSSTGTVSWSAPKTITTLPNSGEALLPNAVVIDTAGNVWITGQGQYTDANTNNVTEAFIYEFASSGGAPTLKSNFTGKTNVASADGPVLNASGNDIALDATGTNVVVAGYLSYEDGVNSIERNDLLLRAGGTSSGTNYTLPGSSLDQSLMNGYSLGKDAAGNLYVLADVSNGTGGTISPSMYKMSISAIDAIEYTTTAAAQAAYTGTNVTISSVSSSPAPAEGTYSLKAAVSSAGAGSIKNTVAANFNLSSSPTLTLWDQANAAGKPFNFFVQDANGNQSYWTLTTSAAANTWQQETINLFSPSGNSGSPANLGAIQYYGFSSMSASTTYGFDAITTLNVLWPASVTMTPSVIDSLAYSSQAAAQAAYTGTNAGINYSTTAAPGSAYSLMATPTASPNTVINNNSVYLDLTSFPTLITVWDRANGVSQPFRFFVEDNLNNQSYWTLTTNAAANTWQQEVINLASPSGNSGTPADLSGITNFGFSQMAAGSVYNFDAVVSENISWGQDEKDDPYVTTFSGALLRMDSNGNPWVINTDVRKYSGLNGSLLWTKYGDPNLTITNKNPGILDGAFTNDRVFIDGMEYSANAAAQAAYTGTNVTVSTVSSSPAPADGSYALKLVPSSSTNQVINSSLKPLNLNLSSTVSLTLWDQASAASKSFRFFLQDAAGHQSYWTLTTSTTANTWQQATITLATPSGNNGTAANLAAITNIGFSQMAISTNFYFDTIAYPATSLLTVGSFGGKDNAFDQLTMTAIGDQDMFMAKFSDVANFSDQTIAPAGSIAINCGGLTLCPDIVNVTGISASGGSGMGVGSVQAFSDNNGVSWTNPVDYSTTTPSTWAFSNGSTGTRLLLAEYMDSYNNWSPIAASGNLNVDSILPNCTLSINNGAPATCSANVTLTLIASVNDPNGGGLSNMEFSNNNSTWSTPVVYSQTSSYTLSGTGNNKIVYSKVNDAVGNWSSACHASINYNTSYTIRASAGTNGTISPTGTKTVTCGGSQAYTITPNATYVVSQLLVDGVAVNPPPLSYTFSSVMAPHTIAASFALPVAPSITTQPSNVTVIGPAAATFSVVASGVPAPTYQWQLSTDGGNTWTAINGATNASYTTGATTASNNGNRFRCVATNGSGSATSNAATLTVDYTITASSGSNGTISPTGAVNVIAGASQSFTITPIARYGVSQVLVDGTAAALTWNNKYTFSNITASHTIAVSFSPIVVSVLYGVLVDTLTGGPFTDLLGPVPPMTWVPQPTATGPTGPAELNPQSFPYFQMYNLVAGTYNLSFNLQGHMVTYTFTAAPNLNYSTLKVPVPILKTIADGTTGGTIVPHPGAYLVPGGSNQTVTVTPNTGYTANLTVNRTPVTLVNNQYTVTNITGANVAVASFNLAACSALGEKSYNGTCCQLGQSVCNDGCCSTACGIVSGNCGSST